MKRYLKPNVLVFSCTSLETKMQGTGQLMLVCSGQSCGDNLGPSCIQPTVGPSFVKIAVFEEGVSCPAGIFTEETINGRILVPCAVTSLSLNGYPVPSPGTNCWVEDATSCDSGCEVLIMCNSMTVCSSGQSIEATVSCSGLEPVGCDLAGT